MPQAQKYNEFGVWLKIELLKRGISNERMSELIRLHTDRQTKPDGLAHAMTENYSADCLNAWKKDCERVFSIIDERNK